MSAAKIVVGIASAGRGRIDTMLEYFVLAVMSSSTFTSRIIDQHSKKLFRLYARREIPSTHTLINRCSLFFSIRRKLPRKKSTEICTSIGWPPSHGFSSSSFSSSSL